MESGVNTGVEPLADSQDTEQDKKVDGQNTNQSDGGTNKTNGTAKPDEPEDGTTKTGESNKHEDSTTDKKKKRTHKKFTPSVRSGI